MGIQERINYRLLGGCLSFLKEKNHVTEIQWFNSREKTHPFLNAISTLSYRSRYTLSRNAPSSERLLQRRWSALSQTMDDSFVMDCWPFYIVSAVFQPHKGDWLTNKLNQSVNHKVTWFNTNQVYATVIVKFEFTGWLLIPQFVFTPIQEMQN